MVPNTKKAHGKTMWRSLRIPRELSDKKQVPPTICCRLRSRPTCDPNDKTLITGASRQSMWCARQSRSWRWRPLKWTKVISSSGKDEVSRVKEITHGKLTFGAIDPICGEFTTTVGSCMRSGDTVNLSMSLEGTFNATMGILDLFGGVKLLGWWLSNYIEDQNRQTVFTREVGRLMEEKVLINRYNSRLPEETSTNEEPKGVLKSCEEG